MIRAREKEDTRGITASKVGQDDSKDPNKGWRIRRPNPRKANLQKDCRPSNRPEDLVKGRKEGGILKCREPKKGHAYRPSHWKEKAATEIFVSFCPLLIRRGRLE